MPKRSIHEKMAGANLVAALASLILAVVVLFSVHHLSDEFSAMKDRSPSDPKPALQEPLVVLRMPDGESHSVQLDDMEGALATINGLVAGAEPFKTCWVSGGIEFEVCTPAHKGQAAHDAAVEALQEVYPNEGDCAE